MAKLLLGKDVAEALNARIASRAEALVKKGITPTLAIIRCGEDPSQLSYERGALKRAETTGVTVRTEVLPGETGKEELLAKIKELGTDPMVHGILLLRPLPSHLRPFEHEICNAVPPEKDVDCMTEGSLGGVFTGSGTGYPPCTAEACVKLLEHAGVSLAGKRVAVLGRSLVVGRPVSMLLLQRDTTVTICHSRTPDAAALCRAADILIVCAGKAGLVDRTYLRQGQIVLDVGMHEIDGAFCGDVRFSDAVDLVRAITPVPGGVGAVTTAVLAEHVIEAAARTLESADDR